MTAAPQPHPPSTPERHTIRHRWVWLVGGWTALALGTVGIFLPLLPTTPFILMAAWCFSRGSRGMHRWLLEHRHFGPMVRDWERYGVIRTRAKVLATGVIVPTVGYVALLGPAPRWIVVATLALALFGLGFIWSTPSRPED